MLYRGAADFIFVLHFCFVLFAVFGGLLVLRRRSFLYVHFPALIWGVLVEMLQLPCPLTNLENYFRFLGGEAGYAGGFIEYFVSIVLYAHVTPRLQTVLGVLLLAFNLFVYALVVRQNRRFRFRKSESYLRN